MLLSAAAAVPLPALAANRTYTGPSGNWSTITWNPASQPANGDTVSIGNGTNGVVTITYDAGATATSLASIILDDINLGSVTLAQGQGNLTITGAEFVGYTGTGSLNLSGGTQTFSYYSGNGLCLGSNIGAVGNATLSGNGVLNLGDRALQEFVGYSGTGTFTQSGGSHTTPLLTIGYDAFGTNVGSGLYTQTGGTLNVTISEFVGYFGNGTVNQSGGTHTAGSLSLGVNSNGTNAAAAGVYSMSNGATLNVTNSFFVGDSGSGTFNQTGGNISAAAGIVLANGAGTGAVNLSGGTLTSRSLNINRASTFVQSGGTLSVTGTNGVLIGNSAAPASYSQGAGVATIEASEYVGNTGNGSFSLSGGTHTVSGTNGLIFGFSTGISGSGTLSGDGVLNVNHSNHEYIGYSGSANFVQSGGVHNVYSLIIGANASGNGFGGKIGSGVYTQSGGALNEGGNAEWVGYFGNGVFNQGGGTNTADGLVLGGFSNGTNAVATGVYSMSNGATLRINSLVVGSSGSGTFNQTGGNASVSAGIILAGNSGGTGKLNLSGGMLASGSLNINRASTFIQSGGTLSITGTNGLLIGNSAAPASYSQSAGVATIAASEYVGNLGSGSFNLSGGSASMGGSLYVGYSVTSTGTVNLSGGTLSVGSSIVIGRSDGASAGNFTMSGGSLDPPALTVNPHGKYVQTSGTATATDFAELAGGTATIGGGTALATLTAESINADAFTVANNALVTVSGATPHAVTNTIGQLTIATNNALLDIDRQNLLLDDVRTPFSSVHNNSNGVGVAGTGIWDRGYNYNPANGFGVWDGTSGITSSTARASAQADGRITIGYIDGAWQNDPNIGNLGIGLPTNRILVRPSLMGDVNLDGVVDGNDIGAIIGLGYYGTGQAPHGWLDGDLNGDGVVDGNDIGLIIGAGTYNNGSYGPRTPTLALPLSTGGGETAAAQTPEPSALGMVGIGAMGLLGRRRRRRMQCQMTNMQ